MRYIGAQVNLGFCYLLTQQPNNNNNNNKKIIIIIDFDIYTKNIYIPNNWFKKSMVYNNGILII
jgi:hypothetical protein